MSKNITIVSLLLLSCAAISTHSLADKIVTVVVASHGGTVILGGSVIPLKEVTLAAQIPGRVKSIAGEEGDEFKAGTLLLSINDDALQAKRQAAEAKLSTAHNAMQNAQVQYNRELWNPRIYNPRPVSGMGFPSMFDNFFSGGNGPGNFMGGNSGNKGIERHADLVTQGTRVSSARARISLAESGLREIETQLRDTKAIAPFDGIILKKMVEVGDTVQAGQPLLVFSYSKFLRIKVEVPARLMPGITKGMVVPARLDVNNTQINARVAQIAPIANSRQHTVTVKFDLPEGVPGGPGMYAEVMIPDYNSPIRALPVVPQAAISRKGSLPSVRVVNEEGVAKLRLIRTGDLTDDGRVTVLSGLKPGERVLVSSEDGP